MGAADECIANFTLAAAVHIPSEDHGSEPCRCYAAKQVSEGMELVNTPLSSMLTTATHMYVGMEVDISYGRAGLSACR